MPLSPARLSDPAPTLAAALAACAPQLPPQALQTLVEHGLDRPPLLPFPAAGATLLRWRVLAAVGAHDLSLAKLFEGHTDALAILREAGEAPPPAGTRWGTWCAEPPNARLIVRSDGAGRWLLDGRKAWCSGARTLTHALVSCWTEDGRAMLARVALAQPGVRFDGAGWQAVGMRDSASVDVLFDGVPATPVGEADFYVRRAGFWHGGAGVAACWFGAACRVADLLHVQLEGCSPDRPADPHRLAQLGEIATILSATAALLRETAAAFDAAPAAPAMAGALAVRLAVEDAASRTLALASRAFGAGPLCKDARVARLFADLPVFMRQSHAERDQAALAGDLLARESTPWQL